ncbi:hypothetical protein [Streptomyces tubercidicus]|uniref:hypothetical protein n=1 Tax=Streptomyces tubercidicus TaxID=47759 RepID=UPI003688B42D
MNEIEEMFLASVAWYEQQLRQLKQYSTDPDIDARLEIIKRWRYWDEVRKKPRASRVAGDFAFTWSKPLLLHIQASSHWPGFKEEWNEMIENYLDTP